MLPTRPMDCALQIGWTDITGLRDMAQAAEGLGFSTIYFPDHLVAEGPERQVMGVPSYDPLMQAAIAAAATSRVRIGHLVLCNLFRHPAVTARSLATLDQLSGGRMVAGLGSGWTETEFRMTGIAFPEIGARLRMLDEALTCLRGLWGEGPFTLRRRVLPLHRRHAAAATGAGAPADPAGRQRQGAAAHRGAPRRRAEHRRRDGKAGLHQDHAGV